MNINKKRLEEIEQRLKNSVHGHWVVGEGSTFAGGERKITEYFVIEDGADVAVCASVVDPASGKPHRATAELFANAWFDAKYLLDLVYELKNELEKRE